MEKAATSGHPSGRTSCCTVVSLRTSGTFRVVGLLELEKMQTQLEHLPGNVPVSAFVAPDDLARSRLRVLHVLSTVGMGGTEHGVFKIIKGLGEAEFEHEICAVRGIDENFVRKTNVLVKMSSVGSATPGFEFPLFSLIHLMQKYRPHIVHTRNFGALEAIPAARIARVPVTIHSEHGYEVESIKGLPLRRRIACKAFYALANQVFTVTDELRDYHSRQSWLSPNRFQVIPNGVNTDMFRPCKERSNALKLELGIPSNRSIIGSIGRIVPIKDHKTLLQAAETLIRQGKDVHVLLIGSGPELSRLRARAAGSLELAGRTLFLGASDRVPELLNLLDVFVLPSISEGMSNTILEAMATGLPLVVTRAGGNPELFEDGSVGCLFNPGDVNALVNLLSRLVDDVGLRNEYGQAARQRAVEHFSLSAMVQHYRDLYLGLASRRGVWKEH
jgi:sugar transferase (PEP-CTERM/EpsH1 system associated)